MLPRRTIVMEERKEELGTAVETGDGHLFQAPSPAELSQVLPNFEVASLLGQGGMGAVYKALQPKLDRYVAIKLLPPIPGDHEHNFGERFEREARAMAGLNHPNIVTVHDFGETGDGHRFIVMEYVDGTDMHRAISSGKVDVERALSWMIQVCSAIQYAHEHDVVHRDIKPANILINLEGTVKVSDFGLAKLVGNKLETSITRTEVAMGTPDYAAPEALEEGGSVDHRVDVYSLGVVFYELLTGKVPRGAWKPPSAYAKINPRLDQIVVKAMQPDPHHRYQTAEQLGKALQEVQQPTSKLNVPPLSGQTGRVQLPAQTKDRSSHTLPQRKRKRDRFHPVLLAFLVLLGVAVAVGGIVLLGNPALLSLQGPPVVVDPEPSVPGPAKPPEDPAKVKPAEPEPEKPAYPTIVADQGWLDVAPKLEFPRDLISGHWMRQGSVLRPQARKNVDRSRLSVPAYLEPDYEVALEVIYRQEVLPLVITLPLNKGSVPLLIGEVGLPDEPPFLAIGGSGGKKQAPGQESARRFPIKLTASGPHSLGVQVFHRGGGVSILVSLDGEEVGRFAGAMRDFAPEEDLIGEWSKQVGLGASGNLEIRDFRVRSLPESTRLPPPPTKPVRPKTPTELLTQPDSGSKGPMTTPPIDADHIVWTQEVRQKISEIGATYVEREADFAGDKFETDLATLREKYNAALNRELEEDDSIPVRAAVQRELIRIRDEEPMEASDPPEMPERIKKLRGIYRAEMAKLEGDLNLAVAPILREHQEELNELEAARTAAETYPPEAEKLLSKARDEVSGRLEDVQAFLRKREEEGTEAMEGSGMDDPDDTTLSGPTSGSIQLARPELVAGADRKRGRVEVWPRQEEETEPKPGGWEDLPSGLGSTVVAIAGTRDLAVAVKSNGRLELWGGLIPEKTWEEASRMDGVYDARVVGLKTRFQLGLLMEDGTASFLPELTLPGADVEEEETDQDLVEMVLIPEAAVGLRASGELHPFGKAKAALPEGVTGVAQLEAHPYLLAGLKTDGELLRVGQIADQFFPGVTHLRDLAFGTHPDLGAVVQLEDGTLATMGTFSGAMPEVVEFSRQNKVIQLVGGYEAFAVQTEGGEWTFFGEGLDRERLAEAARGCSSVVIGGDSVMGLRTN